MPEQKVPWSLSASAGLPRLLSAQTAPSISAADSVQAKVSDRQRDGSAEVLPAYAAAEPQGSPDGSPQDGIPETAVCPKAAQFPKDSQGHSDSAAGQDVPAVCRQGYGYP
jgi:hypothetical protein